MMMTFIDLNNPLIAQGFFVGCLVTLVIALICAFITFHNSRSGRTMLLKELDYYRASEAHWKNIARDLEKETIILNGIIRDNIKQA